MIELNSTRRASETIRRQGLKQTLMLHQKRREVRAIRQTVDLLYYLSE